MPRTIRLAGLISILAFAPVFMGAAKDTPKAAAKAKGPAIPAKIGVISIITGQGSGYGEAITNGFNSPKVVDIAKEAAEGLIVATPWYPERNDPKVKAFVARYEKAYGKKPDQFAAQAYDALYI